MKLSFSKATAVAAISIAFGTSNAAELFSVDETVINPGPGLVVLGGNQVNLSALDGAYTERLVLTSATTFATVALFEISTLVNSSNVAVTGTALNGNTSVTVPGIGTFATNAYKMYGIFTATGNINNASGTISFTGATSTFELYADRNSDNSLAFTNAAFNDLSFAVGNTGDDALLARSNQLIGGDGTFTPTNAAFGNFAILFDELNLDGNIGNGLTTLGKEFFYSPDPFYAIVRTSGQFDAFTLPAVGAGVELDGNLRVTFAVPEPGSLALAGLALVGLAVVGRRKA